jgi:hypothetical protein
VRERRSLCTPLWTTVIPTRSPANQRSASADQRLPPTFSWWFRELIPPTLFPPIDSRHPHEAFAQAEVGFSRPAFATNFQLVVFGGTAQPSATAERCLTQRRRARGDGRASTFAASAPLREIKNQPRTRDAFPDATRTCQDTSAISVGSVVNSLAPMLRGTWRPVARAPGSDWTRLCGQGRGGIATDPQAR